MNNNPCVSCAHNALSLHLPLRGGGVTTANACGSCRTCIDGHIVYTNFKAVVKKKEIQDVGDGLIEKYEAELARLKGIIESRDKELSALNTEYEIAKDRCIELQAIADKYIAVIRCVEAFVGHKILEK